MFARFTVLRALNRGHVRDLTESKVHHWGRRKLKRDMTVLIYVDTSKQSGDPNHSRYSQMPTPRKHGLRRTIRKALLSNMRF